MIRFLVFICFIIGLGQQTLFAQHASVNGLFSVDYVTGCEGLTITLNFPACDGSDPSQTCGIRFGDGRNDSVIEHLDQITYPTSGTYKMIVGNSTISVDSITITVNPSTIPTVDASSCTGGQIQVDINDNSYPEYIINYVGTGDAFTIPASTPLHRYTFSGIPPSPTPTQHTVEVRGFNGPGTQDNCPVSTTTVDVYNALPIGLISLAQIPDDNQIVLETATSQSVQYRLMTSINSISNFQFNRSLFNESSQQTIQHVQPNDFYYCFRLDNYNPCTNSTLPSPIICTQKLEVTVANNENILQWQSGDISANHVPVSTIIYNDGVPIATLPASEKEFIDTHTICNVTTTYFVTTIYDYGAHSTSRVKQVTSKSTTLPTRIEDISAIIHENEVTLVWEQDPAHTVNGGYTIAKRRGDPDPFSIAGNSLTTSFSDATYEPGECYRIQYKDDCDNISQWSVISCPITLTGKVQSDNSIILDWSEYVGWHDGVDHYEIEKYNSNGDFLETIVVGLSTTYQDTQQDDHQALSYVIVAIPINNSLSVSSSNLLELIRKIMLHYANAFTPNGDGLNDVFSINGLYIQKFDLKIYNRWGELIFQTTDPTQGWDGKSRGNKMQESTYVFRVIIEDQAGRVYDESGSFLLLNRN